MSEPRKGKEFAQIDLRKPGAPPLLIIIDDEEEPACMVAELFTGAVHLEIKADEKALDLLIHTLHQKRIELAKHLAFQRGAARAMRRKR